MDHPVTPERWGTEEVKPLVSPDYCWGRVSRQWYRRGEPTQRGLPELRQGGWESGEIKEARVHRSEHQRGEKQTDGELQRSAEQHAWVFSWELSRVCISRMSPRLGKNHPKGLEATVTEAHRELGIVPVPINQSRRPGQQVEFSGGLCISTGPS